MHADEVWIVKNKQKQNKTKQIDKVKQNKTTKQGNATKHSKSKQNNWGTKQKTLMTPATHIALQNN